MKKRNEPAPIYIPMCKISPNSISLYQERADSCKGNRDPFFKNTNPQIKYLASLGNLKNNKTSGFISEKACNRLRTAIKLLFWSSGVFSVSNSKIISRAYKKISLLTLTLSGTQHHPDNYIKNNMLNQFFVEVRKYNKNLLYVWRAEKQKNGNIHFHILINIFLPLDLVTKIWNRIQDKEGYISEYREKHKDLSFIDYLYKYPPSSPGHADRLRKAFIKNQANDWKQPNSIDIKGLKNVKKSYSYISKYISKNEYKEQLEKFNSDKISVQEFYKWKALNSIEGRIWFACEKISSIKIDAEIIGPAIEEDLKKIYDQPDIIKKTFDFIDIVCITAERLFNIGCRHLFSLFIRKIPIYSLNINLNF
jgi:hypothetical protein